MSKKIAIIGGGPAGISAAIQLKRYNLNPILFESDKIGGLLHNAWRVENMPGFTIGVPGKVIVDKMNAHLIQSEIEIIDERVVLAGYQNDTFVLETKNNKYNFDYVIVASGTKPKKYLLETTLSSEIQRHINYEVYPLLKDKDKRIIVVGAGDAAFDYSLNLARRNKVMILNRSDIISALPLLKDMSFDNDNIEYMEFSEIDRIELSADDQLSVSINNNGKTTKQLCDKLLIAIGREEQKDFYSENLISLESDLVKKGLLFLAGDVKNGLFRQTSIAVGDGIRCAMEIFHRLNKEHR